MEPKYSAPNLYASDVAPCQIVSMGIKWRLQYNGFGLINLSNFILIIITITILDFLDGGHVSNRQGNGIYIYI